MLSPSSSPLGATLKGKNFLPWGENSFLKSNLQIRGDPVNTIKVKNKNDFFYLSEGMENCKMSWKNQGKVREF